MAEEPNESNQELNQENQESKQAEQETPPAKMVEVDETEYGSLKTLREQVGKDFNVETWNKLKSIDPDNYKEMKDFVDIVETNPKLYDLVEEYLKAGREKRDPDFSKFTSKSSENDGDKGNSEKKPNESQSQYEDRLSRMEDFVQTQENEKILNQFDSEFDKQTSKLDLTNRERTLLKRSVEEAYIGDHKLGMDSLPGIVKQSLKEIEDYRKEVMGDQFKKIVQKEDKSPSPLSGQGSQVIDRKYDPSTASPQERVAAIRKELMNSPNLRE